MQDSSSDGGEKKMRLNVVSAKSLVITKIGKVLSFTSILVVSMAHIYCSKRTNKLSSNSVIINFVGAR